MHAFTRETINSALRQSTRGGQYTLKVAQAEYVKTLSGEQPNFDGFAMFLTNLTEKANTWGVKCDTDSDKLHLALEDLLDRLGK